MEESDHKRSNYEKKPQKKKNGKKTVRDWTIKVIILTFCISIVLSVISSHTLANVNLAVAIAVLLAFIAVGILFDIIGVSVTAATETPFHSMAAKKVGAAAEAILLIRQAERVSNVCNDVIGDICGIVSGATCAAIVSSFVADGMAKGEIYISLALTALTASMTVGGKAFGKSIAMSHSNKIIFFVAQFISFFKRLFKGRKGD